MHQDRTRNKSCNEIQTELNRMKLITIMSALTALGNTRTMLNADIRLEHSYSGFKSPNKYTSALSTT